MSQNGMIFLGSRNRALFLGLPCGLLIGGWATGMQIADHGFSGPVIIGLVGGILCSAALVWAVMKRWNRKWTAAERRDAQTALARTRTVYAPIGLAGVAVIAIIGALLGGDGRDLGIALLTGAGILFIVTGIVATTAVVTHHGPFSDS